MGRVVEVSVGSGNGHLFGVRWCRNVESVGKDIGNGWKEKACVDEEWWLRGSSVSGNEWEGRSPRLSVGKGKGDQGRGQKGGFHM